MYASKLKLPVVFQKKNETFAFPFEYLWLDLEFLNLPFPLKSHNSWKTVQLPKILVTMFFWHLLSFLVRCLLSTCWKLLPFLKSIWFFFYVFWSIEYLKSLFNSKATSRIPLIIFIALRILTGKKHPKVKLQCLRKIRMLTFGSLCIKLTLFKRF